LERQYVAAVLDSLKGTFMLSGRACLHILKSVVDPTVIETREQTFTQIARTRPTSSHLESPRSSGSSPLSGLPHQENVPFTFLSFLSFFYLWQVKKAFFKKSTDYFSQEIPFTFYNFLCTFLNFFDIFPGKTQCFCIFFVLFCTFFMILL
jgi:hypothetical protein